MKARAAAKAASASGSSEAAASLNQPLWLRPALSLRKRSLVCHRALKKTHILCRVDFKSKRRSLEKAKVKTLLSSGISSKLRPMVKAKAQPHALRQLPKPMKGVLVCHRDPGTELEALAKGSVKEKENLKAKAKVGT